MCSVFNRLGSNSPQENGPVDSGNTPTQMHAQRLAQKAGLPVSEVAGVDEVGYGAWAGPVIVAAVRVMDVLPEWVLHQVRDSKALTAMQRCQIVTQWMTEAQAHDRGPVASPCTPQTALRFHKKDQDGHGETCEKAAVSYNDIKKKGLECWCQQDDFNPGGVPCQSHTCAPWHKMVPALWWQGQSSWARWQCWGVCPAQLNQAYVTRQQLSLKQSEKIEEKRGDASCALPTVLSLTLKAMSYAGACVGAKGILVDGCHLLALQPPTLVQECVVKGDQHSLCIALASVLAKHLRDQLMTQLHDFYPVFGWDKNKGYGTASHRSALAEHGICSWHRIQYCRKIINGHQNGL